MQKLAQFPYQQKKVTKNGKQKQLCKIRFSKIFQMTVALHTCKPGHIEGRRLVIFRLVTYFECHFISSNNITKEYVENIC